MTTLIRRSLALAFCVATATVSCSARPTPPPKPAPFYEGDLPAHAVPVKAVPPSYAVYYGEIKECSGRSRVEFEQIRWYVVLQDEASGFQWYAPDGREWRVAGLAYATRNAIVLGDKFLFDAATIRHEILHLIASPTGHDSTYFRGKCAHLVSCFSACLTDTLQTN